MAEVDSFMLNVISMKVIGLMIKHMAMENICIWMVQPIRVFGMKIGNMEKELRHGLMERNMRELIFRVKSMAQVISNGQMVHTIMENLRIIA